MTIRSKTGPIAGKVAVVAIMAAVWAAPVNADSLQDALVAAYQNNPDLKAARAEQRATDEGVSRATSGFLPTIRGTATYQSQKEITDVEDTNPASPTFGELVEANNFVKSPESLSARVDQNLFRGFQDLNARREAQSLMKAGRARLMASEQRVLLDTVNAYTNVIRDQAVLELRENNVQVLTRQLQASQDRFRVGEITRTDVAQSEARLAGAVSGRIRAEADLAASRALYERVIGQAPGSLDPTPALPEVPTTLEAARGIALENYPDLHIARHNEIAARRGVSRAKGALLPSVDGFATVQRFTSQSFSQNVGNTVGFQQELAAVGVQLTVPLFQGGAEYSDIRRAKQTASQRRLEILGVERQVIEQARVAWEEFRASQASIQSNSSQVRANEIALDGVRQEAAVGSRTTLDVLDAEQELLDSRVNLARAERNEYVAGFALLAAVGRLNAATLDLPVELYDPVRNYKSVRYKFVGWGTRGD